ncbi:sulfurtransferase [Halalkalibacter nanhaiisediminis]|uniref:Thiosulfate/3-mercaptopyruvate sulfurtransferase n=1 Tax=Halalkalibacter nanhaiisediminis TaxID=688079 RepID=A0A562QGT8_9BACI|nr:sulfurtransferase [Halalkalibacter nanhaiisediminis]TWI55883.1 thiosulfate/3-mercaptopyruvate sulfurtransferase [Halalkalibacter nanhaiisediminis]
MDDIVKVKWLYNELKEKKNNLVIVDARFHLADPEAGKKDYFDGHIPEAVHVDLKDDLSSLIKEHGGRHPLPDLNELAEKMGNIGIGDDTNVVVYDDQGGMMASRFWWLMKRLGHNKVGILDGGYSKWLAEGYEITKDIPRTKPKTITPEINEKWEWVDASYVKERLHNPDTILIDSREANRYLGIEEPIDRVAGHIPGAVNHFWKDVLKSDGSWKNTEEIRKNFSDVPLDKEIIVYCGSGISACPNILALKKAGYANVKLYSGSWSDWITHENYPIESNKN